jgi:hypothetical protein
MPEHADQLLTVSTRIEGKCRSPGYIFNTADKLSPTLGMLFMLVGGKCEKYSD